MRLFSISLVFLIISLPATAAMDPNIPCVNIQKKLNQVLRRIRILERGFGTNCTIVKPGISESPGGGPPSISTVIETCPIEQQVATAAEIRHYNKQADELRSQFKQVCGRMGGINQKRNQYG